MEDLDAEKRVTVILGEYSKLLRRAIAIHYRASSGLDFEDILQDASLRVWNLLSSGREIQNVASYLHRVAATTTINAIRRVKARREEQIRLYAEQEAEHEVAPITPRDQCRSPEVLAEQKQLAEIIRAALKCLRDNRRRAVALHLEGLNSQEIAQ